MACRGLDVYDGFATSRRPLEIQVLLCKVSDQHCTGEHWDGDLTGTWAASRMPLNVPFRLGFILRLSPALKQGRSV